MYYLGKLDFEITYMLYLRNNTQRHRNPRRRERGAGSPPDFFVDNIIIISHKVFKNQNYSNIIQYL